MEDRVREIKINFDLQDDTGGDTRVPPLVLVRCTRGGKTRALTEMERRLKITPKWDVVVIRISTNDFSGLDECDDLGDHIQILCRRIAFFLLHPYDPCKTNPEEYRKAQWRNFDGTVSKEVLEDWLGDRKCILLIDELNNLGVVSRECATWLKNVFLGVSGRYLVFTSHIVSTSRKLIDYMEPRVAEGVQQFSRRGILVKELPLVPNLTRARELDGPITSQKALYLGLIPSLIHVHARPQFNSGKSPVGRAKRCANMCLGFGENSSSQTRDSVVTDCNIRLLLHSFLSGSIENGMADLLPLMSVGDTKETTEESASSSSSLTTDDPLARWIPFFMREVLNLFAHSPLYVSDGLKVHLVVIVELFDGFNSAKSKGGDGWECLFVIPLIIRCVTGDFDSVFFPNSLRTKSSYLGDVSYNRWSETGPCFDKISTLNELWNSKPTPPRYPHIDIYYPAHASFVSVDVVLIHYVDKDEYHVRLFQLKEGETKPTKLQKFSPMNCPKTCKKFAVRGKARGDNLPGGWVDVGTEVMNRFFGVSGRQWTPEQWMKFQ